MRQLRRSKQELTNEENIEILKRNKDGVLAVLGDDEYPYTVPLNYIYLNDKLYFHCALEGHKIDAIRKHEKVSFCIVDKNDIDEKKFTTLYKSVIIFGKIKEVQDKEEKLKAIYEIASKFSPSETEESKFEEIKKYEKALNILCLTPDVISGKQCIELVKE